MFELFIVCWATYLQKPEPGGYEISSGMPTMQYYYIKDVSELAFSKRSIARKKDFKPFE